MPNFFVVGAARCGTTSFVQYLDQHPDIYMAPRKESHFFSRQELPARLGEPDIPNVRRLEDFLIRDPDEYAHQFDGVRGEHAIGESSVYYICLPETPARIASVVPEAKIIILLRSPVDRAYSSYLLLRRGGRETLPFAQSLALEVERKREWYEPIWWYTELSRYAEQVERYLTAFGRERVHVILTEDLDAHPEQTLQDAFRFLGVRDDVPVDTSWRRNAGGIPKSGWTRTIQDAIFRPNPITQGLKALVPARTRARVADRLLTNSIEHAHLSPDLRAQLWDTLRGDVTHLEQILQYTLDAWTQAPSSASEPAS